jgi:hypothetical protein
MRVTILGKRWNLRFAALKHNWGDCDPPEAAGKEIRIAHGHEDDRDLLNTCLHECLHCAFPDTKEETINQLANDLERILWRLGWKRREP